MLTIVCKWLMITKPHKNGNGNSSLIILINANICMLSLVSIDCVAHCDNTFISYVMYEANGMRT